MEINTLKELFQEVKALKKDHSELWYRGQQNATYKLVPSLARHPNGFEMENKIFETYCSFAKKLTPTHTNEWELLIDMQHYFVPTRLLDWSESLGIALFFAYMNNKANQNAGLFILDPIELNKKSNKYGIPVMPENTMGLSYVKSYINKEPYPVPHPIAIKCSYLNDRVLAQHGMFTIHTDTKEGLEDLYPEVVKKYTFTTNAIEDIAEYLEFSTINVSTVFPDFYGVASYIKLLLG